MNLQLYTILLAIGAVQGIVLGSMLFTHKSTNRRANRILAILLFFMAYRLLIESGNSYGIGWVTHWSYQFLLEYNWIYGALIFFYVRSYLGIQPKWKRKDFWHFVPVLVEVLFSFWVKLQNFYWDGTIESLSPFGSWSYQIWEHTPLQFVVAGGLILFYSIKAHQLLQEIQANEQINLLDNSLKWIKQILRVYQGFSILLLLTVLTDYLFSDYAFNSFYQFPVYIIMAILTYWLGLQAYLKRNETVLKKVKSSALSPQLESLAKQIDDLMAEEKLFLNPNLSLADLAEALNIKTYLITQALNQVKQQKFNDYINQLRIDQLQHLLQNSDYQHYNLLALAFESGFNSKASFNRIVKKMTGKSPSELRSSTQFDK
ncbi:MAG: helix-turn-helix transcriptional regulator [Bacteroidota bacterium]